MSKKIFFLAVFLCMCLVTFAQDEYNQHIEGRFNKIDTKASPHSYIYAGKVDKDRALLKTKNPTDKIAASFQFKTILNQPRFDISLKVGPTIYKLKCINGLIRDLTNGISNVLDNSPFLEGEVVTIAYVNTKILFQRNAELLGYYDTGISQSICEADIVSLTSENLEGKFSLTESFIDPTVGVNFTSDEYTVNEGGDLIVSLELASPNSTAESISVDINIVTPFDNHFNDDNGQTHNLIFQAGEQGPLTITIPTDLGNELKDDNLAYTIVIVSVTSPIGIIGVLDAATINVIDDYIPPSNNLNPGDMMIVGFDNVIDGDAGLNEDKLILTNLVEIEPGTSFQITRASHTQSDNKWYDNNDPTSGQISAQRITYTGTSTLDINTIFCLSIPGGLTGFGLLVSEIEVDGVDAIADFIIENITSNPNPNINISSTTATNIFLMQGDWTYHGAYSKFYGNVLSGIQIGGTWTEDGSYGLGESDVPDEITCFETQGQLTSGSHWAYFQCQTPFGSVTIYDLRAEISDFTKWEQGIGTNDLDFDALICESTCDIVESYDDLAVTTDPVDLIVECDGTSDPSGAIQIWLDNNGYLEIINGCYPILVTNNFSNIDPNTCGTYPVQFTITDGCDDIIIRTANIVIEDNIPPVLLNVPANVTVNCGSVPPWAAVAATDQCDDNVIITEEVETTSTLNPTAYFVFRTWTATDACGNQSTDQQRLKIINDLAEPNINASDTEICGTDLINTLTFSTNSIADVYDWYFGAGAQPAIGGDGSGPYDRSWYFQGPKTIKLNTLDGYCYRRKIIYIDVYPSANANTDPDTEICKGESIVICADYDVDYNYNWSTGHNTRCFSTSPLTNSNFTVTVTDENLCTDSDDIWITLHDNPIANAGSNKTICQGESVLLCASYNSDYSYAWSTGQNNRCISVGPSSTTNYTVTVTDSNGCTDTDVVTVFVNSNPIANAGSNDILCDGETVQLCANYVSGYSYSWSTNHNSRCITVSPSSNTNYTVTVTDSNGCTDTDVVTVFVNSNPIANAGPNKTICIGSSTTLNGSGGGTYLWSPASGLSSTTIPNPIASPIGTSTYTLQVINSNGCTDTDVVTVFVNNNPNADAGPNETICEGESVQLCAVYNSDYSYAWSTGQNGRCITFSPPVSTNVTVTVTDGNQCTDTDIVTVFVNNNPNADAGPNETICNGESVQLCAVYNSDYSYAWSTNQNSRCVTVSPILNTNYTVTVTDGNQCTDTDDVYVDVIDVTASMTSDIPLGCNAPGNIADWTALPSGGTAPYTYSWLDPNGVEIGNVVMITTPPLVTGTYQLIITDANGCVGILDIIIFACIINDDVDPVSYTLAPQYNIYPNPTTGWLNLDYQNKSDDEAKLNIKLLDMSGRLVSKRNKISLEEDWNKIEFDFTTLDSGLYIMVLEQGDNIFVEKISIINQ